VYYVTQNWAGFISIVECCIETESEPELEILVQILKVKPKPRIE